MLTELLGTTSSVAPAGSALLLAVALLVAGDAVLPVLPSETAVVSAGVLVAATGVTALPWLMVVAATAAVVGDLMSYRLGRTGAARWDAMLRSPSVRGAALRYAQAALDRRGPAMVATSRFVPGGRTAVTLSAGAAAMPLRAFVTASAVGASVWAPTFAAAGFVGGRTLGDNVLVAMALAVVLVLGVTVLVDAGRRLVRALRRRAEPTQSVTAVTR
jgi:membrane protein DedA with SNARE-associated domain